MNVGLPGTGIGGLFYLATAFLMPVAELYRTARGRSSWRRWRQVGLQAALAAGIIGGLWLTAWALRQATPRAVDSTILYSWQRATRHLGATPAWLTVMTLVGVLLGVELLHWALRLRQSCRRALGLK